MAKRRKAERRRAAKAKQLFDQAPTNPPPGSRCLPFEEQPKSVRDAFLAKADEALASESDDGLIILHEWSTED